MAQRTYTLERVEHLPAFTKPDTLHLLCRDGVPQKVFLTCPCGICGDVISINLVNLYDPCWRITQHDDKTISLYPSIRRKNERCSVSFSIGFNVVKTNGHADYADKPVTPG